MDTTPRVVGAGPVLRALCEEIGLVAAIDAVVPWDRARCRLSPGERILALGLNLLTARQPLYRVQEQYTLADAPLLWGAGITSADLSDDALGRALDKVAAADGAAVFSAVALRALTADRVLPDAAPLFVHWDSTTRSGYGTYPTATADGPGVHPTYGHSTDHRPDRRQIVLTRLGTREGIPLAGRVPAGNASDKPLNRDMLAALGEHFSPAQRRDLVYGADAALVTGPKLAARAAQDLQFLSRLPETVGAAAAAKAAAWAGPWGPLGRIGVRADAATYQASEPTGTIDDRPYRLVVYRSSHLDRRKARTLARQVARAGEALATAAAALARAPFACAADAEAAAQAGAATATWHTVTTAVVAEPVVAKRARPGRPRADAPPPSATLVYRVHATVGAPDPARIPAAHARASCFVLLTTRPADRFDARRLLQEYKEQTVIEQRLHFLKDPAFGEALFVHKPERVAALGYVLLRACLVLSLLERRVRQGPPLPTPSRGRLERPTGHEILHHLAPCIVLPVDAHTRQLAIPPLFANAVAAILAAAGFTDTVYTRVPTRNTS